MSGVKMSGVNMSGVNMSGILYNASKLGHVESFLYIGSNQSWLLFEASYLHVVCPHPLTLHFLPTTAPEVGIQIGTTSSDHVSEELSFNMAISLS